MANLFRNSSPGALTREQAVELLKKRLAERRRLHQNPNLAPPIPFDDALPTMGATASFGSGGANQANPFAEEEKVQPGNSPNANTPTPSLEKSALDRFLASMSKSDLQGLKSALNDAAVTTGVVEIFVGGALVSISAGALLVTVTLGGLTLAVLAFGYFANKVDEYLSKQ
ncbi:MAG: hypothetical protein K2P94_15950 [Rhodospirillaceae bacterium]|nr:hypothetical protein [Rhodospirillaceae bacterium]